jgi:hypothetical protein
LITPRDTFLGVLHDKTQFIMTSAKALILATVPLADIPSLHAAMYGALDEMMALVPPPSRALTLVKRLQKHRGKRCQSYIMIIGIDISLFSDILCSCQGSHESNMMERFIT